MQSFILLFMNVLGIKYNNALDIWIFPIEFDFRLQQYKVHAEFPFIDYVVSNMKLLKLKKLVSSLL